MRIDVRTGGIVLAEMTVERKMVGTSIDMLLREKPIRGCIEIVNSGGDNYTISYDNYGSERPNRLK